MPPLTRSTIPGFTPRLLQGAKVTIGGENIRQIPFRYASAAITFSIHQLTKGPLPASLQTPEFEADREAFKALDQQITEQIAEGKEPDPATVEKLIAVIYAAEEKAARLLPRNTRARNEADRFLKGLHGLAAMLKTPAIDVILSGVENRPDATLGELLNFMTAFNLRFGVASTPQQRRDLQHPLSQARATAQRDRPGPGNLGGSQDQRHRGRRFLCRDE